MNLDLERKLYYEGIQLFNGHEFFEAHETWEDVWHMATGPRGSFYQGLIQCAVALEHYLRSNPRGVASLFKSYNTKFTNLPDPFMGLHWKTFLEAMHDTLRPVLEADPIPERGQIEFDPSRAPKIALAYDPFETGEAERLRAGRA